MLAVTSYLEINHSASLRNLLYTTNDPQLRFGRLFFDKRLYLILFQNIRLQQNHISSISTHKDIGKWSLERVAAVSADRQRWSAVQLFTSALSALISDFWPLMVSADQRWPLAILSTVADFVSADSCHQRWSAILSLISADDQLKSLISANHQRWSSALIISADDNYQRWRNQRPLTKLLMALMQMVSADHQRSKFADQR